MNLSNIKIPHTFIFLFLIIVFCAALSYVIPSGAYQRESRVVHKIEQSVVVPGSFEEIPKNYSLKGVFIEEPKIGQASPNSVFGVLLAIPKGLTQSATLIFYIFILGAVFALILETKTIHAVLAGLIKRFKNSPTLLFLLIYILISAGSSFMGISIEVIPLIPILVVLAKQQGYDKMFGVALGILPVSIGWSTAITNPFTVQIAQQIAELPIGSGILFRVVIFLIGIVLGFGYLMRYGNRVRAKKRVSLAEFSKDDNLSTDEISGVILSKKHLIIVVVLVVGYGGILAAVQLMGWGLLEMSAGFLGIGLAAMWISGMSGKESMAAFEKGLRMMIIPALIVGVARGISVVMQESQIMDSILFHFSNALSVLPKSVATVGMLVFQSFLNFFIPSASGQALVSMPLMTPLADILGFSRQTAVLAFILGDGFSNLIIPTNAVLMAMIGVVSVSFTKWIRFVMPIFIMLMVMAAISMVVAVTIGY
ncbi:YfcC family protein [Seonamhaeicola maritimus]|uniref:YfcC family protein n=1 Tax=Seonamhaeicola maritimus TaxID=2591822 RepID=A0A5C7GEK9_9FLAO|nr:AbgT family transporter [Seonamhaeicola maritimus]TXG35369.1 YfcC family protein [Seonamhaeicola maritimus]